MVFGPHTPPCRRNAKAMSFHPDKAQLLLLKDAATLSVLIYLKITGN